MTNGCGDIDVQSYFVRAKSAKFAFWPFLSFYKIVLFLHTPPFWLKLLIFMHIFILHNFTLVSQAVLQLWWSKVSKKRKFYNQILGGKISENFFKKRSPKGGSKKLEIILFSQLKNPDENFFYNFFEKFSQ